LAPHNDISGGKVLRSRTLKVVNRATQAYGIICRRIPVVVETEGFSTWAGWTAAEYMGRQFFVGMSL
jgi:hypothetical protein